VLQPTARKLAAAELDRYDTPVIAEAEPQGPPPVMHRSKRQSRKEGHEISFVPFAVSEPSSHLGEDNLFLALKLVQDALGDDLQMGVVLDKV
jgi:hypothetical protein